MKTSLPMVTSLCVKQNEEQASSELTTQHLSSQHAQDLGVTTPPPSQTRTPRAQKEKGPDKATQWKSGLGGAQTEAQRGHPWAQPPAEQPGVLGKRPAHPPLGLSFPFNHYWKRQGPSSFCLWIQHYIPGQPHLPEKRAI